ncbi:MAG: stage III sporulation protein AF [Clostridia bacterium]|nr:MAG: stage III sporulation protein AF [Clostridia bacterium]
MESLSGLIRQIVLIAMLAAFVELFLPRNDMARFVRLIMGLFIVVSVLTPVLNWLNRDAATGLEAWVDGRSQATDTQSILVQGENLAQEGEKMVLDDYSARLARQVQAMVRLVPGVEEAEVTASLPQQEVMVEIQVHREGEATVVTQRVRQTVSDFFGWPREKVRVRVKLEQSPAER